MLAVCLGISSFNTGIYFMRIALAYRDLVKMLPTLRATKIPNVIGTKMLMDDVVSSMITTRQ